MQYEVTESDGAVTIHLAGRLDAYSTPVVEAALTRAVAGGGGTVTVDCGGVSYISSAGLRVLLVGAKAMKATGRKLRLTSVLDDVLDVITLAGMQPFFDIARAPATLDSNK